MTYLQFLVIFVVAPAFFLAGLGYYMALGREAGNLRWHWLGVAALAGIAFVWTTPWDNYIVANGVWTYGVDRVTAVIGYVPVEEYAFFILMPVLNGALFFCLLRASGGIRQEGANEFRNPRLLTCLVGGALMLGAVWLFRSGDRFFYLSTTLVWFVPPLMVQWCFDAPCLVRNWRLILLSTLLPALYLGVADYFAIQQGIWTISEPTRTGWDLLGLPLEEAFFFLIVSLLLSQGMVLWHRLRRV